MLILAGLFLASQPLAVGAASEEGQFRLTMQLLTIPERGEVTSYVLLADTNRFSFLPPLGWKVTEAPAEKTVNLTPRDFSAQIAFRVLAVNTNLAVGLTEEKMRRLVATRHPDAKIIRAYVCRTSDRQGVAVDFERLGPQKLAVATRLAVVVFPTATVEFEFSAAPQKFKELQLAFGNLLTSFRYEASPSKPPP